MKQPITLTEAALIHFQRMLKSQNKGYGIRVGVKKSGCSGLAYVVDFAVQYDEKQDKKFKMGEGVTIIIDQKSMPYLQGTEIDCAQQGLNAYLTFDNPNVKGECGCGESFTVEE